MFFILVYIHIARGLYYGSYRAPRATLWIVGVVIYICMMAELSWPNWYFKIDFNVNQESKIILDLMNYFGIIPAFSRPKNLAMKRIGPHNHNILIQIISSQLADGWMDRIPSKKNFSYRFKIDQEAHINGEYIRWLTKYFYEQGYCN